jgi:hypothetical protein
MDRKRLIRIGFWGVLGVLAAVLLLSLIDGDGDDSSSSESTTAAEIVSVDELRDAAVEDGQIYWAGEQSGSEIELSRPEEGRTYVRYLPEGTEAGDPDPNFLTVGTYAFPDAAEALRKESKGPGGVLASAPGGGVVYFNQNRPQNVYLAFPGEDIQIEVYDPDAKRALGLVSSGLIVPVG